MTPNKTQPKRYWNIATSENGKEATLTLEGEITDFPKAFISEKLDGHYYTSDDFRADLEKCKNAEEITVNINSPGGDLYVGLAIFNALKSLPGKVTTIVSGVAASAASVIFCAGDTRQVYKGSLLMVHGVHTELEISGMFNDGDITSLLSDLRTRRDALRVMNDSIAGIYAQTTGMEKDAALALISNGSELWMTADDAIEKGFSTGYSDDDTAQPLKLVACAGKTSLYSGSRLLTQDFHAPQNAAELGFIPSETAPAAETETTQTQHNMETENTPTAEPVEATPAPAPVDTAAIAAQARTAERARIASITAQAEKLGSRVDKKLVNLAINGDAEHEPMTPEAFAMAAINALAPEQAAPANYLAQRETELASNSVAVAAPPVEEDEKNHGLAVLARLEQEEAAAAKR